LTEKFSEEQLREIETQVCSWGDTVHYASVPPIFKKSEGSYLYDIKGHKYLDWQMWYSACNFGYANEFITDALKRQLDELPQLACQYLHEEKILLAREISEITSKTVGLEGKVQFNVGGSSAVEDALKVARNYTGKQLAIAFYGGYHGRTLGATAVTSSARYRTSYGHFGDRAIFVPYPYCFNCFYDLKRETCGLYCAKMFEKLFESEYFTLVDKKGGQEPGMLIFEAVQGTGGYARPPEGYFERMAEVCKEHGILTIADEIQMGFFRTGKMWSVEHFGITPDIIVFGKALTNGLNPISGIIARKDLMAHDIWGPGMTHCTFSSNPLGTTTGLAVMELIKKDNFEQKANHIGEYLTSRLKPLTEKYPVIGCVDNIGAAIRVEITGPDGKTPDREACAEIFDLGLDPTIEASDGNRYGLILDQGGWYKSTFTIAPNLYSTDREMDLGLELFEKVVGRVSGKSV
jgi:4-aminobutyrate aminotransferase-like enzyme